MTYHRTSKAEKIRIPSRRLRDQLPRYVYDELLTISDRFHVKTIGMKREAQHVLYIAEGEHYWAFRDGQVTHLEVVACHNVGAAGVSYAIGSSIDITSRCYVVRVSYLSRFYIDVICVDPTLQLL